MQGKNKSKEKQSKAMMGLKDITKVRTPFKEKKIKKTT